MTSQDILQSFSPELVEEVFASLHATDKVSYHSLLETLATRRKLRPVYLERKPRSDRHLWMREQLVRPSSQDLADQVLQVWLLSSCRPMICAFLDNLGIAHDGQGLVDVFPKEPASERVQKAVHSLLKEYSPTHVAIYLNFFAAMAEEPWPELSRLLSEEETLQLGKPAVA